MSADWKIQKVHLQGYRGIRDLAVDFAPDVTVLVGKNGVGKSAVLDALATLFHQLFDTMSGATVPYRMFTAGDISNRESAMRCAVTFGPGSHAPENGPVLELRAEMERPSVPFHETVRFPTTSSVIVALMNEFGEDAAHELPFVVAYGMDRVDRDADHPPSARDEMLDPYVGSLSRGKGNFEIFQQWYGLREDIESEGMRFRNQGPPDAQGRLPPFAGVAVHMIRRFMQPLP